MDRPNFGQVAVKAGPRTAGAALPSSGDYLQTLGSREREGFMAIYTKS